MWKDGFSMLFSQSREDEDRNQPRELVSTVGSLLSSPVLSLPTKRYEEVDGVRKEKERLTTDHQPQHHIFSLDMMWLVVSKWLTDFPFPFLHHPPRGPRNGRFLIVMAVRPGFLRRKRKPITN